MSIPAIEARGWVAGWDGPLLRFLMAVMISSWWRLVIGGDWGCLGGGGGGRGGPSSFDLLPVMVFSAWGCESWSEEDEMEAIGR